MGGYDGENQLKTVERYDTEKDMWEFVTPVKAARSALSVSVLDNKLYAMGKLKSYLDDNLSLGLLSHFIFVLFQVATMDYHSYLLLKFTIQ